MLFLNITLDGLQMGLCFAVLALGVYISYSILDFPDLSVDGTFPLGGVVCTVLLFRLNLPPVLPSCSPSQQAPLPGQSRDCSTLLKITPLLSAIIVMTALLSVTLALTQLLTPGGYTTTIFSTVGTVCAVCLISVCPAWQRRGRQSAFCSAWCCFSSC